MEKIKGSLNVLLINTSIYEGSQAEINNMYRESVGFHGVDKIAGMVAFLVGIVGSWGVLNAPPNSNLGKVLMKMPLLLLLLMVLAGGVFASGIVIYGIALARKQLNNKIIQKRIDANQENIRLLEEKCKVSKGFINSSTVLPDKYKYYQAVNHIYGYIDNMRADSIKEAINLYELELRGIRDSAKLDEISRLSRRALEMAAYAADKASNAEYHAKQTRYY